MNDCLFCKMASGEITPDAVVHRDDEVLAFRDISPQAPVHILVIPRVHIEHAHALGDAHSDLLAKLFAVARRIAEQEGIAGTGYRLVLNCNEDAGQTVYHLHMHLLGGRRMDWPPG